MIKKPLRLTATLGNLTWYLLQQLTYLCQMVFILRIVRILSGFEEKVSCEHLKDHAGKRPHVGTGVVIGPNDDLWRPVLTGLDLSCEVMMFPTSIAEVCDFDADVFVDWVFVLVQIVEQTLFFARMFENRGHHLLIPCDLNFCEFLGFFLYFFLFFFCCFFRLFFFYYLVKF